MDLRGQSIPDELYLLCALHNIGATSSDRSLTLEEISRWTANEPEKARENLEKLMRTNYVIVNFNEGVERFHITTDGIRKVLSMYS